MNGPRTTLTTRALVAASVLGATGLCTAAERSVPNEFATIQAAINAASDGDVIVVGPGTYHEALDLYGKELTLRSTGGAVSTVIDGSGHGAPVVHIDGANGDLVTIDGFTIRGGTGRNNGFESHGGGLYVNYMEIDVQNCVFTDNHASVGGGAWLNSSDAVFRACEFIENSAISNANGGGGVFASLSALEITQCRFESNEAHPSGGGVLTALGESTIRTSVFAHNESVYGAGMVVVGSDTVIAGCTFRRNIANDQFLTNGGGLRATNGATAWVTSSVFWENVPSQVAPTSTSSASVNHSFVMGGWDGDGESVSSADPRFNGDGLDLLPGSPCVDSGDPLEFSNPDELDIAGQVRVLDGNDDGDTIVDAGAYELMSNQLEAGACCFADGSCQYDSRNGCETAGGTFVGGLVECEVAGCVQPPAVGACCMGSACQSMTESECELASGAWQGADVTCAAASCGNPNGACCLGGDLCFAMPLEMCELSGGSFLGAGTTCASGICDGDPPPATGACCLGSSCSMMTQDDCNAANGLYQGDDVSCSMASCPCDGDLDASYDVGFSDLVILLDHWGGCGGCAADLDGSGDVGFDDLMDMLLRWGPCP